MSENFGFRLPADLKIYLQGQAMRHRTSVSHYLVMLILEDKRKEDEKIGDSKTQTLKN